MIENGKYLDCRRCANFDCPDQHTGHICKNFRKQSRVVLKIREIFCKIKLRIRYWRTSK